MKRIVMWLQGLVALLLLAAPLHAAPIKVMTEDYPPFNMAGEGGKVVGLSTEVVEELFKRAGVEYTLTLMPWKRAYEDTLSTPGTALFSTTRTPERETLFKWVGPLVTNNWVFFAKSDATLSVNSLDEAKAYSVGGYNGDAAAEYLAAQGFSKLQLAANDAANAKKLEAGRIDLWATGEYLAPYLAKKEGVAAPKVVFKFKETQMSLAFNKETPDDLIQKLNDTLKGMVDDGTMAKISAKYQ
ncbi:amino acid ABC transporter substrate-binding protein [Aeromonas diversa CDC 2478-85]|uniref:Amino acid ABC transporter substrate-binding protein n=2 Tax=Aeromonas diversa TaxID=502790 RepID=N9V9Z9_9GAMM|nr:transporter substrate-binding domain-containing protein [Aeromonas diversa]ENY72092.1 amino acid ABC transporter substrate-binding protein [Aeromonas diversa CDC 2478-85]